MDLDVTTTKPLKLVFLAHFILMSWGVQGYWSSDSYLFYNLLFLGLVAWSIHAKEEADPIQLALAVNLLSVVLDLVILSIHDVGPSSNEKFSYTMAIVNLLVRVPSSIIMFQNCKRRLGTVEGVSNIFGGSQGRDAYDNIDSRS